MLNPAAAAAAAAAARHPVSLFVIVCLLFCLHTYADATAALHAASGGLKIIRQLYFFAGWPKYKQLLEIIFFASLFYRSLVGMGVPQAHMVGPLS